MRTKDVFALRYPSSGKEIRRTSAYGREQARRNFRYVFGPDRWYDLHAGLEAGRIELVRVRSGDRPPPKGDRGMRCPHCGWPLQKKKDPAGDVRCARCGGVIEDDNEEKGAVQMRLPKTEDAVERIVGRMLAESSEGLGPPEEVQTLAKRSDAQRTTKRTYIQYIRQDDSFTPAGKVVLVDALPPFTYEVVVDNSGTPHFIKAECRTDELYYFKNSTMSLVLEEIERFWTLKANFDKLGFLHHRGILMHGPPGTGKSAMIQQVGESMIRAGNTLFFVKGVGAAHAGLKALREVEPDRRVVVVMEDMDEYIGYSERDVLQLMDGKDSVDNALFLGTTNYIEKFPLRLLRPGRFDKKVRVDPPPVEGRRVYLQHKLKGVETPERIDEIAHKTPGFSFGHLRELVIGAYAFEEPLDEVIERLMDVSYGKLPVRDAHMVESLLHGKKRRQIAS